MDGSKSSVEESLSARRAWIEIIDYIIDYVNDAVALRKESVDRNNPPVKPSEIGPKSLSARRAWIEIMISVNEIPNQGVALRKESVDRNVILPVVLLSSIVALRKESVDRNERPLAA